MDIRISYDKLEGKINPIFSKSTIHRSLCASIFVYGEIKINNITYSKDVLETLNFLEYIGCIIKKEVDYVKIDSSNIKKEVDSFFDVFESGTTLRFIIPILIYLYGEAKLNISDALLKRTLDFYEEIYNTSKDGNKITFTFKEKVDTYIIEDMKSSQYISGLLFILPLLKYNTKIVFKSKIESFGYIELTIDVLKKFGIEFIYNEEYIEILGNQKYNNIIECDNEYDESNLVWFKYLNFLGHNIIFDNNRSSKQPDSIFDDILSDNINKFDIGSAPDLVCILGIHYSMREGGVLYNTSRLKYKESNRILSTTSELNKLGCDIKIIDNKMIINKVDKLVINNVESFNDHRIAMMLIICAHFLEYIEIKNVKCINKSYPVFIKEMSNLGAKITKL